MRSSRPRTSVSTESDGVTLADFPGSESLVEVTVTCHYTIRGNHCDYPAHTAAVVTSGLSVCDCPHWSSNRAGKVYCLMIVRPFLCDSPVDWGWKFYHASLVVASHQFCLVGTNRLYRLLRQNLICGLKGPDHPVPCRS